MPAWARRFRTGAWAFVLPLSIAVVVGAIAVVPSTADVLTWVALLLVPVGCGLALGWAARGARPWLAPLAAPLLAIAWTMQDEQLGQAATTALIVGSAVTLGRLLASAAPLALLKAAVVAMATVDAILVFSNSLQAPNAVPAWPLRPARACRSCSRRRSAKPASATATSLPPAWSARSSRPSADRSWWPRWR